ncbi:E2 ligase fold family C protein [Flavisolibacter ginsengisoli]|jgi:molybdopterin/thiamine biosynthesis adenylyltransferase|uniref:ThiF family protein n=1 Tax=Flavisolibacter ginsengisoli DSM 18119 TaxID=1121884 RepID=A0A1M5BCD9_9BACT|nr:E2 ligase fold family C protein [Flavisolibacter ginsengisoli]SHF40088.1 ThiF family protein [Flavisolibacter ginsengisoli DSM 18119]
MALANFFDKISLGAAQRIKNYDRSSFENKLLATRLAIVYSDNAVQTNEGKFALDLAVRILARLYPNIQFVDHSSDGYGSTITKELKATSFRINPVLNVNEVEAPDITLVIGSVDDRQVGGQCFFTGSSGWKATFSTQSSMNCADTQNPFGAAASVCIAAANIFRFLFAEELGHPSLDREVCFSVFSQQINAINKEEPALPADITLGFTLVGTGAIGNSILWCLLQLPTLKGFLNLIDDQEVSLTNLQRYALMEQEHVRKSKVVELEKMFTRFPNLTVNPFLNKWQEIIATLRPNDLELMAVALDSKEQRLLIQSTLPKKIINAWTSQQDIGVSRHFNFAENVCLACLYIPKQKQKSESVKIAESLKLPEELVRNYIANSIMVDEGFIFMVAKSLSIPVDQLRSLIGKPVQVFYSEGICGERIIRSSSASGHQDLEVPLAHESFLAGILAAAEIIIESAQLRLNKIEPLTKINLLMPLHNFLKEDEEKNLQARCICTEPIFVKRFKTKWSL